MTIIVDANILLRVIQSKSAQHSIAVNALQILHSSGNVVRTTPQSIYEFWVVATRPIANNGLGLSVETCEHTINSLLQTYPILLDQPNLFSTWRDLTVLHQCHGKIAHDARIVAAMQTHNIQQLLTFNIADFQRFTNIHVIDPNQLLPKP